VNKPLHKITCVVCAEEFETSYSNVRRCPDCLDARPLCKCGCGHKVKALRGRSCLSGGFNEYLWGHSSRVCRKVAKCKICDRKFKQSTFKQNICERCLDLKPQCACGCGKRVPSIREAVSRRARVNRFIHGHDIRLVSPEEQCRRSTFNERGPTNPEKELDKILKKLFPKQFLMNVDGKVLLGGKIPDFVNVNGRKVVIEMFGDYWHGEQYTGRKRMAEEAQRKKHFAHFGFSTVIVWEHELDDFEKLRKKLIREIVGEN
jgi:G:T-mismatch repair DNA endonuclease (very short patch repair protein)